MLNLFFNCWGHNINSNINTFCSIRIDICFNKLANQRHVPEWRADMDTGDSSDYYLGLYRQSRVGGEDYPFEGIDPGWYH